MKQRIKPDLKIRIVFVITIIYLAIFTLVSILDKNIEFLYYNIVLSSMVYVTIVYYQKMHLSFTILCGLAVAFAMHMCGGNLHIGGIRLYDFWLIPGLFKYDNLVHSFSSLVGTFVVYNLLRPHLDKTIKHSRFFLATLIILITLGLGVLVELIEFLAVILFNVPHLVGDYYNTGFDLTFNTLGSIFACFIILVYIRRSKTK